MGRYTVAEATQINYDGVVYGAGETVEADETEGAAWVAQGIAVKATAKPKRGAS